MDLMNPPENFKECCDSLSCLHAIEHFGMGRYGDRVDLDGHVKGFRSLCAILKPGGLLDFSVPIGPDRIDFNASRVFFPFNPFWHWLRILSNLKLFSGNTFIAPGSPIPVTPWPPSTIGGYARASGATRS